MHRNGSGVGTRGALVSVVAAMLSVQALASMSVLTLAAIAPEVGRELALDASLIGYQIGIVYLGADLSSLIGDFSFAIWDARRSELLAQRDAFGIKPFFYTLVQRLAM